MPYLTVGGHKLYYEWRGEHDPARDAVIFLHHGLGAVGSWKDLPDRIAEATGLNALVYDRLGYGLSDARMDFPHGFMEAEVLLLLEMFELMDIGRAHLVGHSDGGSIALLLAARYPERVVTLVCEAAHSFVEPETQTAIRKLLAEQAAGRTPEWLTRLHGERAGDLLRAWGNGWLTAQHTRWSIEDWLGYVTCPTLVIQGDQDEYGTLDQVTAITNRIGGSEKWILPGGGHAPHADQPEVFCERVTAHIASHTASDRD